MRKINTSGTYFYEFASYQIWRKSTKFYNDYCVKTDIKKHDNISDYYFQNYVFYQNNRKSTKKSTSYFKGINMMNGHIYIRLMGTREVCSSFPVVDFIP